MKKRCAPAYCCRPPEKSRMMRSTLAEVGITMYTASKPDCTSRLLVMDSMTYNNNIFMMPRVRKQDGEGTVTGGGSARVTFSSKMSNCLRTELRSCCECSSITRIFHLEGGLTERIASKNSAREVSTKAPAIEREDGHTVPDDGDEGRHAREWLATARAALDDG
jgi:hypothetical protein